MSIGGRESRLTKGGREEREAVKISIITTKGNRIRNGRKITLTWQDNISEPSLIPGSANRSRGNCRITGTNGGGTQTTQFEQVE